MFDSLIVSRMPSATGVYYEFLVPDIGLYSCTVEDHKLEFSGGIGALAAKMTVIDRDHHCAITSTFISF